MSTSPTGRSAGPAAAPLGRLRTDSGVTIAVYRHDEPTGAGALACVSFVSEGLPRFEQDEVVVTLPASVGLVGGKPRDEPLRVLDMIASLAAEGRTVGVGAITQFRTRAPFGKHLLYVRAPRLHGVPLDPSALAALLVSEEELGAATAGGPTRLLSRLGAAQRWYPFPACLDPGREGLPMAATVEASILSRMGRKFVPGAYAVQTGEALRLLLPSSAASALSSLSELDPQTPFALLTELDPAADACLFWVPGQTAPSAISPPGSRGAAVGGAFFGVNGGQEANVTQVFEDGFVCSLTEASWLALRRALVEQRGLGLPASSGLPLHVLWR